VDAPAPDTGGQTTPTPDPSRYGPDGNLLPEGWTILPYDAKSAPSIAPVDVMEV
jgi:hypothetical protein